MPALGADIFSCYTEKHYLKRKVQSHDKRKRNRLKDALFVDNMIDLFLFVNLAKHLHKILAQMHAVRMLQLACGDNNYFNLHVVYFYLLFILNSISEQ